MGPSVGRLVDQAARRLAAAGSPSSRLEAQLLLGHATGWPRSSLLAHPERVPGHSARALFARLVQRRAASEPVAYLLGEREFHGRPFRVDRRALIPRPETELLVEIGLRAVGRWRSAGVEQPRVADVGTGSGAVALSIAAETGLAAVAVDLSWAALTLARENAARLGQSGRVRLVRTDLLAGLRGPLHVVLANLPYIPSGRRLPPDVGEYEPPVALRGGPRGTELLERLLREAGRLLAPGGELALELDGEDQARSMTALARHLYPGAAVETRLDAGGCPRVVRVRLSEGPTPPGEGRQR